MTLPGSALPLLLGASIVGCAPASPPVLLGGTTTVFDESPNAFSQPAPGLDRDHELQFFVGNSFFNQNWVTAPASTTARDGLGPLFNTRSCAGCHLKDGRGRPPSEPGELGTGLLVRISRVEGSGRGEAAIGAGAAGRTGPDPVYGGQIQDQAIDGVPAEARIVIEYVEAPGPLAGGPSLRSPRITVAGPAYGPLDPETRMSARLAPQMIGLGLLEAVPEEEILALSDPDDRDGDGISGRPNRLPDAAGGRSVLGRFGWKASVGSVRDQVAGAFLGDLGITTPRFPSNECTPAQTACAAAPHGGAPEITEEDFEKVVLYSSSLAVPAMRNADDPEVARGYRAFGNAGCSACHVSPLRTGAHPLPALSNQTIHPYTDLLLHDMGEGLADGRPDGEATGSEWRTPPLWGIGLSRAVNGNGAFLHDGRARDLEEAILWHGGEGAEARDRYVEADPAERAALLRFLESL